MGLRGALRQKTVAFCQSRPEEKRDRHETNHEKTEGNIVTQIIPVGPSRTSCTLVIMKQTIPEPVGCIVRCCKQTEETLRGLLCFCAFGPAQASFDRERRICVTNHHKDEQTHLRHQGAEGDVDGWLCSAHLKYLLACRKKPITVCCIPKSVSWNAYSIQAAKD